MTDARLRERIAFELWNDTNPRHLQDDIKIDNFGEIITPLGNGWTGRINLDLDWRLNRNAFLQRADIALNAIALHDIREMTVEETD